MKPFYVQLLKELFVALLRSSSRFLLRECALTRGSVPKNQHCSLRKSIYC